jgi:hypothetical protein
VQVDAALVDLVGQALGERAQRDLGEEVRFHDGPVLGDAVFGGLADAGVVDQQVDTAMARLDVGEHTGEAIGVAHVAHDVSGRGRQTLHLGSERPERLLPAGDPGDHGAIGRQVEGDAPAESGRRAGHDPDRARDRVVSTSITSLPCPHRCAPRLRYAMLRSAPRTSVRRRLSRR